MGVPMFAPQTVVACTAAMTVAGHRGVDRQSAFCDRGGQSRSLQVGDSRGTAIGAEICTHRIFRIRPTWSLCASEMSGEIEIRIFERGVGPTTSSGTGTSAAATAALALRGCVSPLTVVAPGGAQTVAWDGPGTELFLTGPAALIARGEAW